MTNKLKIKVEKELMFWKGRLASLTKDDVPAVWKRYEGKIETLNDVLRWINLDEKGIYFS